MRLIDADELYDEIEYDALFSVQTAKDIVELIFSAPTVDAVPKGAYEQVRWERDIAMEQLQEHGIPFCGKADVQAVRHGKIMEYTKNGKKERVFSCCGSKCTQLTMWVKPLYCIYCGAKMDGE